MKQVPNLFISISLGLNNLGKHLLQQQIIMNINIKTFGVNINLVHNIIPILILLINLLHLLITNNPWVLTFVLKFILIIQNTLD